MNEIEITKSSGNIFVDLGFDPDEAATMLIRVEVACHIIRRIKQKGWSLTDVSHQLCITQPQATKLINNKLDGFSLDTLCVLAVRLGMSLELTLTEK